MTGRPIRDLRGQKFNRLTVLKLAKYQEKSGNKRWVCICECGNKVVAAGGDIVKNSTKSCGCLRREDSSKRFTAYSTTRSGYHGTRVLRCWNSMMNRCHNENNRNYKYYGARGIIVCKRWCKFENFLADMGEPPEGLTLDRIDNDGNYCKANCRWATRSAQIANRRPQHLWFAPPGPKK